MGASPNSKPECRFAPSATKMQETRNKMPSASVYLLENLHFLQFFVADSVPGSIIIDVERVVYVPFAKRFF